MKANLMIFKLLSLILQFNFSYAQANDLRTPECDDFDKVLVTPITFFLPKDTLQSLSEEEVHKKLGSSVLMSNLILKNSCIPMKREVARIVFIDELTSDMSHSFPLVHSYLEHYYARTLTELHSNPAHYYGFAYSDDSLSREPELCGKTNLSGYSQFFMFSLSCDDFVLEHELGHLAFAQHDTETLSQQEVYMRFKSANTPFQRAFNGKKEKKYALAYRCGGAGTIMSYAKERLDVYSSPDITYNGEKCGNEKSANNARVVKEYVSEMLERN